jgi:hypothetical protein
MPSHDSRLNADLSQTLRARLQPPRYAAIALTDDGAAAVRLADVFDSVIVERHWAAVIGYLLTSDPSQLTEFARIAVAGRQLMSDPVEVDDWFAARGRWAQ